MYIGQQNVHNLSYSTAILLYIIYIYMLNKNTLGVKKVQGQSEATCKQADATKSFDYKKGGQVTANRENML